MSIYSRRFAPSLPYVALVTVMALAIGACAGSDGPELVAVTSAPTPTPLAGSAETPTPIGPATPTPAPTPTAEPTPTPVPVLTRGISNDTVGIAIVKTASVFGDVEVGVSARIERTNTAGGVGGRSVEIVDVLNDRGDPDRLLRQVQRLVNNSEVFAVVLATAVPTPEVTDLLAESSMPFFGWGFAPGFCLPNEWGFGFNGCLIGTVLGIPGAAPDTSPRELVDALADEPEQITVVVSDDPSGAAARATAEEIWGDRLTSVIVDDAAGGDATVDSTVDAVVASAGEVAMISVGLDRAIALKAALRGPFDGLVVDDVSYLPGLLSDFAVADALEGGYAHSQFPPQEEYREVTGVMATDLEAIGADLIYSQAVSLGYWSSDLMLALMESVGPDLNTSTFHQKVNVDGVRYDPEPDGAPCPMDSVDIHRSAAGGGALVAVTGGIYFPAVAFTCFG
ncbi:MAG: ABC transporter substrate-binding protein [Acidimicrobiales bacterium]